jgi:hypothetical protein
LWTGAQPIFAARPTTIRRNPTSVASPSGTSADSERHESASSELPGVADARRTMPRSEKQRPSEVSRRYFHPASSARG